MNGSVFREIWRQTRVQALLWGLGLASMGFLVVLMIPDAKGLQQMKQLVETLPPLLIRAIGSGTDLDYVATPEGFIAIGFFGKTLLLLAAYPVITGLRVTVNEEHSGTLDILLSFPIARWRVLLEKFLAYALSILVITVLLFVGLWAGKTVTGINLDLGRIALTVLNTMPSMILILAFTIFIGSLMNNRRIAIAIATAFVLVSFMVDAIGQVAQGTFAEDLRALSFFRYYNSTHVMRYGLVWSDLLLLLGLATALLAASFVVFQRRDVGV
jgi:ABC-2 type transport system permease protein